MSMHRALFVLLALGTTALHATLTPEDFFSITTSKGAYGVKEVLNLARREYGDPDADAENDISGDVYPITLNQDTSSSSPTWDGKCFWQVPNVGLFTSRLHVDNHTWTTSNFNSSNSQARYFTKTNAEHTAFFQPSQVMITSAGGLQLISNPVPSGSTATKSVAGEIRTAWGDIQSGSIRTVIKGDVNPGAVYGFFFYGSTSWAFESDIELRGGHATNVSCTNQYYQYGDTTRAVESRTDVPIRATTIGDWHEYRIDWIPGSHVTFFVDGAVLVTKTNHVPVGPGSWIWNSWSSTSGFSEGPSRQRNALTIASIDMYVNRTNVKCGP